jgi:O-antigen/teichoic acid export membrane protein
MSDAQKLVREGRAEPGIGNLRTHTARGTLINSAFQVGLAALAMLRRVAVAAFLTREEFGVWGIILATLITLAWLKQVGIGDKYVQQSEPDQEAAFQKAFTIELVLSSGYFVLCVAVLPLYALAYGHGEIVVPGIVLASSVILTAFESPAWIAWRRMQYARQRVLLAVDPVIAFVVTVALCAAGLGYWGLVVGAVAGSAVGGIVCVLSSPYRVRLRFDRRTAREYVSFSWPLVGLGLSGILVVQGALLVANHSVGLAGVGAIGLATSIAAFANRVDGIVSETIYPAVVSVADRAERLAEVFVKSNRVALMWAMPFAVGLALFASDLVHFVLGERWAPAIPLLAAIGLTCGFQQVAFNWSVIMRAVNRTRPMFVVSLLDVAVFVVVSVPAILTWGLAGYAAGFAATTVVEIAARWWYMRSLFGRFNVLAQIGRAVAPVAPAAALVGLERLVVGGDRTPAQALIELATFVVATVAFTYVFERRLVTELLGYVRGRVEPASPPRVPAGA